METIEIQQYISRVLVKIEVAKRLLNDGKEIQTDKKLQGISDNLVSLVEHLGDETH